MVDDIISALATFASKDVREREQLVRACAALRTIDDDSVARIVRALDALSTDEQRAALPLVGALLDALAQRARVASRNAPPAGMPEPARNAISRLYNDLRDAAAPAWAILGWLAATRSPEDLALLAELLATAPPGDAPQLAVALSPLFQRADYDPASIFPRALDALAHRHLAGAVLDLANYLTRSKRVARHPAFERRAELMMLLGALVQRLTRIEEEPDAEGRGAHDVGAIVAESLPLAVSLCDALALIGDAAAIGKLHQAMEIRHRRLRTEAAGALARLGDKKGADILVELAAEPVARLRVLAYARELGIIERIPGEFQTAAAQAESRLALWLAQPAQFGLPPTELDLIDEREQFWPGFDDMVECFLFRFEYALAGGVYASIGISGPLEHAFAADLADLPPDDIYAAFAGWHAQHEEIREQDVATLNEAQRVEVARLQRRLTDHGFSAIAPVTLASFFGERVLVATAIFDRHPGIAVVTQAGEISYFARSASSRPLGPMEAFCIFKGRRLLRTFNE